MLSATVTAPTAKQARGAAVIALIDRAHPPRPHDSQQLRVDGTLT